MKKLLLILTLLFVPTLASAQCTGVFPTNTVCGTLTSGTPHQVPFASFPVAPLALTQYHFLIGNASNIATDTALSGDCTYGALGIICTKTNGVAFGTFATQSAPTGVASNCLQANTSGVVTGTGAACATAGSVRIVTGNDPVLTTDCGKILQLGTGSTGIFTETLPAVAGFSTPCPITILNGDTTTLSGKLLSGFPSGCLSTKYFLFPGVAVSIAISNGAWIYTNCPGQFVPTLAMVLGVDASGSDTTGDGFTAPFQTMQHCIFIYEQVVLYQSDITQPTCRFTSNLVESAAHYFPIAGTNTLNITASSAAFTWKPSGANIYSLAAGNGGNVQLSNFVLSGTGTTCFSASGASACTLVIGHNNNVVVETLADMTCTDTGLNGTCFKTDSNTAGGAQFNIDNGLSLAGTVGNVFDIKGRSSLNWNGTVTAISTPTVANIFQATGLSAVCIQGNFATAGSFGTTRPYAILNGAQLWNVSGTAIPGSTPGITTASGFTAGAVTATAAGGC